MFTMRFDMRAKDGRHTTAALYEAALEMAVWAEREGGLAVVVSEHHGSPDGYLPAPLLLASAIAARTSTIPISVAALLVPLHDPVAVAEQMCVLDIISRGRVSYICGVGYRAEEYSMFGCPTAERGARMDENLEVIRRSLAGEAFEHAGRHVVVTPHPISEGGPSLAIGGGSAAAARRAARLGLPLMAQTGGPHLEAQYRAACEEFGQPEAGYFAPEPGAPESVFVGDDVDRAWDDIGEYLLHDARMYASWLGELEAVTKSRATSVEELRAEEGNYRIFTVGEAIEHIQARGYLPLQPLCGGIPPARAWESLELITTEVLPAVRAIRSA